MIPEFPDQERKIMSFGRFRLLSAMSASAFFFWKRAKCTPPDQSTPKELTNDDYFMATALLAALRSKDPKTKVGACIVTEYPHRLVGLGYNGMPDGSGFKDAVKTYWRSNVKKYWRSNEEHDFVCHAEMNAIISAFRWQADLSKCTLYTTHFPCDHCCKIIAQSGIKNVVYATKYQLRHIKGVNIKRHEYQGVYNGRIVIDLEKMKASQQKATENGSGTAKDTSKSGKKEVVLSTLPMDDFFMAIATLATIQSKNSNPVGASLVTTDPHHVTCISVGHLGLNDLFKENDTEQEEDKYMCHAQLNVIISALRHRAEVKSTTLYTTSPLCFECAKIIVQSGVGTVIYYSPMKRAGTSSDDENTIRSAAVKEIMYRAKIPYWKYQQTKKMMITIDLKNHTVELSGNKEDVSLMEIAV